MVRVGSRLFFLWGGGGCRGSGHGFLVSFGGEELRVWGLEPGGLGQHLVPRV